MIGVFILKTAKSTRHTKVIKNSTVCTGKGIEQVMFTINRLFIMVQPEVICCRLFAVFTQITV